ncbi:MAG TPA: hypothetical protein VMC61_04540 [Methanocella sp.]|nr:hypothetical protein [Methanocella sp.]
MDNLTQRRIIAAAGIVIALLGLTVFLWGLLKNDYGFQLFGFVAILGAYVLMVVVKKLREKVQSAGQGSKLK